ncbi:MAG: tRNA pseudouridine(55) synthase TruB [Lachnospiraceae bacterium]|nr:tRNA pseudouridine(55) synthase TruB [Lachnospiraceae bacterium]
MYNGIIVIHKEPGYTSSDVVAKMRGILRTRKMGHTGTLDPDAVGVLPVCLGNATKLVELIADRDKEYLCRMRLGLVTDTQDTGGEVLRSYTPEETLRILRSQSKDLTALIESAAERFVGDISQIPPMYSAVRIGGKRLYELARAGKTIDRPARQVTIRSIEIAPEGLLAPGAAEGGAVPDPVVTMRVVCGKGTYIRTLCEDIGEILTTGAAMEHLTRTRVGNFYLEQAVTLDELDVLAHTDEEALRRVILPTDSFFPEAPKVTVRNGALKYLENGNPLGEEDLKDLTVPFGSLERVRVYDEEKRFYALYRYSPEKKQLVPVKMFLENTHS